MISIIVPTRRIRPESLQRTLDSIERHTHKKYEVIIAEGGDCYSASMNIGLKKAKGDYLTIPGIADDIEVCEGWDSMVDFLKLNPEVGMGVYRVDTPWGLESYGGFVQPDRFNLDPNTDPQYCGYGLVTRECFEKVGLMDENFKPIYCEDADYGIRVWEAGYKLSVCPHAKLLHHHEQAGRETISQVNKDYLIKKHNL